MHLLEVLTTQFAMNGIIFPVLITWKTLNMKTRKIPTSCSKNETEQIVVGKCIPICLHKETLIFSCKTTVICTKYIFFFFQRDADLLKK